MPILSRGEPALDNCIDAPVADRRKHRRSDLYHPIRFKLFSRDLAIPPIDGYLKDISLGGARIALDDPYGQFNRRALEGVRTKLQVTLPESEQLQLLCVVCWVRARGPAKGAEVELGLEFVQMEPWQLERIQHFMALRHTDHTMFWNLWDTYQQATQRQS